MSQVFPPGANWIVKWTFIGGGTTAAVLCAVATGIYWGPPLTTVGLFKQQPIPFSHFRHVSGNGIDCRYCHTTVETSSFAGIPPTETCMTCHSQILTDQTMLSPVRDSWRNGDHLEWIRVSDLPDFVYFDHSIHINRGVGCSTCHGRVDLMPLTRKAESFHMSWCLRCHRHPEKFIRERDEVFIMDWEPPSNQIELGKELIKKYNIEVGQLTNCSICHR